jgi:membrane-bound lytic murein transglycosylase D
MTTPPPLRVRAEMGAAGDAGTTRQTFTFERSFRIGRTDDCEICIKNEHVSRKHVEVVIENGHWLVRDLQSANGIFVNGERVQFAPIFTGLKVRLGIYGPFVEFLVAQSGAQSNLQPFTQPLGQPPGPQPPPPQLPVGPVAGQGKAIEKTVTHYFGNPDDASVGEHTRMVRRAFAEVQTKQKRKYGGIISALVVCAAAAAGYAFYLHLDAQKNRVRAQEMFYAMKDMDLNIARIEKLVSDSGNAQAKEEVSQLRSQRQTQEDNYQKLLVSLKVYDPNMTEQQKLVLKVARIFGECELDMPKDFYSEVDKYIGYWKSTGRYMQAIRRAQQKGYAGPIAAEFIAQDLPPQFFYLAMQESTFDEYAIGPKTYMGYAKGMWQFIPLTARDYGLNIGPLVDAPDVDVKDDRHHWDRETKAAAAYIKFLYSTDAQASGLLVMACYNWGERSVLPLVKSLPKNPRERNFWKLLTHYRDKIPDETYKYVFYITSAAVIGENPRLFGMDCDPPLKAFEGRHP